MRSNAGQLRPSSGANLSCLLPTSCHAYFLLLLHCDLCLCLGDSEIDSSPETKCCTEILDLAHIRNPPFLRVGMSAVLLELEPQNAEESRDVL